MATKKTEEVKTEETKAEETKAEETKAEETKAEETVIREYDPWTDMLEVNLPRKPRGEQNFQYVAVNDRRFQVPCGQSVMVPRPVYEALANAAAAKEASEKRKEELYQKQYQPLRQM